MSHAIIMSMKLPNRKNALIEKRKLTHYLLSLTHLKGKSKAKFFRMIGFNETNIARLEQSLLQIGKSNEIITIKKEIKVDKKTSGIIRIVKYDIDGVIKAPNGKQYKVKTVWAIEAEDGIPHLATAHPSRFGV